MNNYSVRYRRHPLSNREYRVTVRALNADEARIKAAIRDPEYVSSVSVHNNGIVHSVVIGPPKCYLCHRTDMVADGLYTRIDFRGRTGIQLVCDTCLERAEEAS